MASLKGSTTIYVLTESRGLALGPLAVAKEEHDEERKQVTLRLEAEVYEVERDEAGVWQRVEG